MKSMKNVLKTALILSAGALIMSGCGTKYIAVETTYVQDNESANVKPEVVETKEYKRTIKSVETIAVAAPEKCKSETISKATGTTTGNDVVMKTECGIEMGEIERSLAKAGYQVISWQIIANSEKMAGISAKNITRQEIAKEKGADILLQINSLERTTVGNSGSARWERRYFDSDKYAALGQPVLLDERTQKSLKNITKNYEKIPPKRLGATIDASAISVDTGRAIWFYQWTNPQEMINSNLNFTKLATCKKTRCRQIRIAGEVDRSKKLSSGDSEAISIKQDADDAQKALYHKLLRGSIKDMVRTFKGE